LRAESWTSSGLAAGMPRFYTETNFIHLDWKKQYNKNKQVDT